VDQIFGDWTSGEVLLVLVIFAMVLAAPKVGRVGEAIGRMFDRGAADESGPPDGRSADDRPVDARAADARSPEGGDAGRDR
jgi:hypothetical protein